MKSMFAALAAAVACLTLSVSGVAHAQTKPKSGNEEMKAAADMAKGRTLAPAMIAAAKIPCTLAEANFLFTGKVDRDGKKVDADIVEVACQNNLGYVLSAQKDGTTTAYDCIITSEKQADGKDNPLKCRLEGNSYPARKLQPVLDAAGVKCAIDKGVAAGMTATKTFYELSCKDADGVFVAFDRPRTDDKIVTSTCYQRLQFTPPCSLTTRAQSEATVLPLAAMGDKGCAATQQRYMGSSSAGASYIEFACPDGSGMVVETKAGQYSRSIPCNLAVNVLEGCKLTQASAPPTAIPWKTEDNAIYTQLAKKAGFNCDVSKYGVYPRVEGQPASQETLELVCANRPDGGVAIFSNTNHVLNCVHGRTLGYRCTGSEEKAGYHLITAALKAKGRETCQVSNAEPIGTNNELALVEVACADGLPGFVVAYKVGEPVLIDLLTCGQAAGIRGGCKLPGNKKS